MVSRHGGGAHTARSAQDAGRATWSEVDDRGVDNMTMTTGLRVAVVGCGYWGSKHVRVLQSTEGVDQVVLVDARETRLQSLVRSYPNAPAFTSLEPALPHVDAVVVATPPTTHVPLALRAIAAGKHVLVEKPLATDRCRGAPADRAAAEDRASLLMAGHTFEYNPAVWKLRELVQRGDLGDIYYIDTARLNLGLYQTDVNVVIDLAPHDISIINYVLGQHAGRGRGLGLAPRPPPLRGRRLPAPVSTTTSASRPTSTSAGSTRARSVASPRSAAGRWPSTTTSRPRSGSEIHDKGVDPPWTGRPHPAADVLPLRRHHRRRTSPPTNRSASRTRTSLGAS